MTDEQRQRKNERDRERRAEQRARRESNAGVNPATKLPHTERFIRGAR